MTYQAWIRGEGTRMASSLDEVAEVVAAAHRSGREARAVARVEGGRGTRQLNADEVREVALRAALRVA